MKTSEVYQKNFQFRPYIPSPTMKRFHASSAFVRMCCGPVGSGKTAAAVMEIFSRALETPVFNGVRRSRWAIVRATYPELISTSLKTWTDWIPESVCPVTRSPPITARMQLPLSDGTILDMEVLFISCDSPDAAEKFRSLELTGAFLNELSELDKEVLDILTSRVGRFPPKDEVPVKWSGIIADTNPTSTDHFFYTLSQVEKPKGFAFFFQPPAVILAPKKGKDDPPVYLLNDGTHGVPAAENLEHLDDAYYLRQTGGKDPNWIKLFLMGEFVDVASGKPVFPEFKDSFHTAPEPLKPYNGLPLFLAMDFGLNPSVLLAQYTPKGQLVILDEITTDGMGIQRMIREMLKPLLKTKYPQLVTLATCDPAGSARSQTDEISCLDIVQAEGFEVYPAATNNFVARREAVVSFLTRTVDGKPAFLLSPTCEITRRGLIGRYAYRKLKLAGHDRFVEKPDKNEYSHLADCIQYLCLFLKDSPSAPESNQLLFTQKARPVVPAKQFAGYV